ANWGHFRSLDRLAHLTHLALAGELVPARPADSGRDRSHHARREARSLAVAPGVDQVAQRALVQQRAAVPLPALPVLFTPGQRARRRVSGAGLFEDLFGGPLR